MYKGSSRQNKLPRVFLQEGNLPFLEYFLAKELHEWLNTRRKCRFKHKISEEKESAHKNPSFARCMVTCETFQVDFATQNPLSHVEIQVRKLQNHFRMLGFTANAQLPSTLNFARWSSNFARCEIVPQLDAVVFRRQYLPHFSSKLYTV